MIANKSQGPKLPLQASARYHDWSNQGLKGASHMSAKRTASQRHDMKSNVRRNAISHRELCSRQRSDCAKLRREVAELRAENQAFRQAFHALTNEPVSFDKKSLLAQVGKRVPLQEFIAELERGGK
jgi:hypothetical protein